MSAWMSAWHHVSVDVCLAPCQCRCLPGTMSAWMSAWHHVSVDVCLASCQCGCLPGTMSAWMSAWHHVSVDVCLAPCQCGCLPGIMSVWMSAWHHVSVHVSQILDSKLQKYAVSICSEFPKEEKRVKRHTVSERDLEPCQEEV
ncbi:hypothetical protein BgiBS90_021394 [Biomphalaria glabrata]|nr:hypothetical protein BgiBS90_021394 [Biomphalaria glabrata]